MTRPLVGAVSRLQAWSLVTVVLIALGGNSVAQENGGTARGLEFDPPEPPEPTPDQSTAAPSPVPAPPGLVIPDVPGGYAGERLLERAFISQVQVRGNSVLPQASIAAITSSYEQRELSFEELEALRLALTRAYIEAGYVNSGVLLPDQDLTDGILRLEVIEGKLQVVELSGNQHLRRTYIEKRLLPDSDEPFNVRDFETSLRLMQQWPMVAQVNAELLPGRERGEMILDLKVRERDPFIIAAGYDNHRPPSVGEDNFTLSAAHQSLTGNADTFSATYGYADGADDWLVNYSLPLTASDLTVGLSYADGTSDIVEQPFDELDIVTKTETWAVTLHQPVVRTLTQTLVAGVGFEHEESRSTLLDSPFSFSPGEQAGEAMVTSLFAFADWTLRRDSDAVAVRTTLRQGVDWLDATVNPGDLPDSEFTSLLLQAQYARRLPLWNSQFLARLTGQLSSDPLLPVERLAMGGATTVRGYRENLLVRDEGVIAGLELRVPVLKNETGESRIGLTFVPFVDYGWAKDKGIDDIPGLANPDSEDIASVGGGLIWNWWQWFYAEAYYGYALTDEGSGSQESSLQEDGIHLMTTLRWSF